MWLWDNSKGIYKDGNYQPTRADIASLLETSSAYAHSRIMSVLAGVQSGSMSMFAAETEFRTILKSEYIRQYLAGIGGQEQVTQSDYGRIGAMLKKQYSFIHDFLVGVQSGLYKEGQISNYAKMYAKGAHSAYEKSKSRTAKRLNYTWVAWNLGLNPTHCPTCERRSGLGYVEMGSKGGFPEGKGGNCWPGDGQTECLTNDNCYLSFMNSAGEEYWL